MHLSHSERVIDTEPEGSRLRNIVPRTRGRCSLGTRVVQVGEHDLGLEQYNGQRQMTRESHNGNYDFVRP